MAIMLRLSRTGRLAWSIWVVARRRASSPPTEGAASPNEDD